MSTLILNFPNGKGVAFDSERCTVTTRGAAVLEQPSGNYAPSSGAGPALAGPRLNLINLAIAGPKSARGSIRIATNDTFDFDPIESAHVDSFFDMFGGGLADVFKMLHNIAELIDGLSPTTFEFHHINGEWVPANPGWRSFFKTMSQRNRGLTATQRETMRPQDRYAFNFR